MNNELRPKKTPIKVRSVDGEKILRREAVKVDGVWYRVNDERLITIDGTVYLKTSPLVVFDHETKDYKSREKIYSNFRHGIVNISKDRTGQLLFEEGFFTGNRYNNTRVFTPSKAVLDCISVDIAKQFLTYFPEYDVYCDSYSSRYLREYCERVDFRRKGYSIEDNGREFKEKIETYNGYKTPTNKNILPFAKLLGDNLTFGMEVETIAGKVEDYILYRTGTVICRDGSLTTNNENQIGAEYVTVPMNGVKGLSNIQYLMTEIQKVSQIDLKCSLHFHFGGFNTDRYFLVALYKLCMHIQDELFTMFPYYKTNPAGVKHKNYNQKLQNIFKNSSLTNDIEDNYIRLFRFLSGGADPDPRFNRRTGVHPAGSKWNISSRYYWVNFNNAVFSKRNTIEFRLHTPTMNYMKAVIWLFMCNAIIRFAEANQTALLKNKKFRLKDVFNYYADKGITGEFVSKYLIEYHKYKTEIFAKDKEKGDNVSMHDIEQDHKFDFKCGNISYWF